MLTPLLVANAFAVAFLVLALFRPNVARMVTGGGFIVASLVNATLALRDPQIYVRGFGPYAVGVYKDLIYGILAQAPGRLILALAVWQFIVGAVILTNSTELVRLGCAAATIFLIGLSPLGLGCGFPSNLIFAAGVVVLIRLRWPLNAQAPVAKARARM
jgi:hypothetical protein